MYLLSSYNLQIGTAKYMNGRLPMPNIFWRFSNAQHVSFGPFIENEHIICSIKIITWECHSFCNMHRSRCTSCHKYKKNLPLYTKSFSQNFCRSFELKVCQSKGLWKSAYMSWRDRFAKVVLHIYNFLHVSLRRILPLQTHINKNVLEHHKYQT